MHSAIRRVLHDHQGVLPRTAALGVAHPTTVQRAIGGGDLHRPFPRTYVDGALSGDRDALLRAAVAYAGECAALSHTSALGVWCLPVPEQRFVHLITGPDRHLRGAKDLRIHRREGFRAEPPEVVVRDGLPVIRLEQTIVDCWPLLDGSAKRAPAIFAVSQRMTTPDRIADALSGFPRLGGRRYLVRLLELLRAGCRSELELWGYEHVFCGPEFASLRWQVPVDVDGRTVYLDAFDPETGVNIELDGTRYHAALRDRERDLRRDAALQALGILVVRISHYRLVHEPDAVRREVLAIIAARRAGWTPTRLG